MDMIFVHSNLVYELSNIRGQRPPHLSYWVIYRVGWLLLADSPFARFSYIMKAPGAALCASEAAICLVEMYIALLQFHHYMPRLNKETGPPTTVGLR